MGNIKLKNIFYVNNHAVSAVIGVILMVAITVAIAATVYVYFSGMMGGSLENTPTVSMIAESSEDKNEVLITIITIADKGINWHDVSGVLVNLSSSLQIEWDGLQTWKLLDDINGGDLVILFNTDILGDFTTGDKYRFTLVYDITGGTMGTVTWTH
jgi:FlaG/FlaF family flagellin (archaellin)